MEGDINRRIGAASAVNAGGVPDGCGEDGARKVSLITPGHELWLETNREIEDTGGQNEFPAGLAFKERVSSSDIRRDAFSTTSFGAFLATFNWKETSENLLERLST